MEQWDWDGFSQDLIPNFSINCWSQLSKLSKHFLHPNWTWPICLIPGTQENITELQRPNLNESTNHRMEAFFLGSISLQSSTVWTEYLQIINDPAGHTQRINKIWWRHRPGQFCFYSLKLGHWPGLSWEESLWNSRDPISLCKQTHITDQPFELRAR